MKVIYIDGYEPVIEKGSDGSNRIQIYAVKGKGKDQQRYPIPKAFEEMCTDRYLAITEMSIERPEVMELPEKYWAPLCTDKQVSGNA